MKRPAALVTGIMLLFVLTACMTPLPESTSTPSSASSATSTPTPAAASVMLPGCEALLSLPAAQALLGPNTQFLGESAAGDFAGHFEIPQIPAALVDAAQSRICHWGIPNSDGAFSLVVAEISATQRTTLTTALTTAGFASSSSDPVTTLELEREGVVSSEAAVHLFTGDVWVLSDGTGLSVNGPVAVAALTSLRSANPTLGL